MPSFKKGQSIKDIQPYVKVLIDKYRNLRCDYCFIEKDTDLLKCSACLYMNYCSKQCQANDWIIHKKECRAIKKFSPNTPDHWIRFYFYVIQRYLLDVKEGIYPKDYAQARNDMSEMTHFFYQRKCIQKFVFEKIHDDVDVMLDLYLKMKSHYIPIKSCRDQLIGYAIYTEMQDVKQNCEPNSASIFFGSKMRLLAVKDIDVNDVNKDLTYCYVDNTNDTATRCAMLTKRYLRCGCDACEYSKGDNLKIAKKCFIDGCRGMILNGNSSNCTQCGRAPNKTQFDLYVKVDEDTVTLLKVINELCDSIRRHRKDLVNAYEQGITNRLVGAYNKVEPYLHPLNVNLKLAHRILYNKAMMSGNKLSMMKYLELMIANCSTMAYPSLMERILRLKVELIPGIQEKDIEITAKKIYDEYVKIYGTEFEISEQLKNYVNFNDISYFRKPQDETLVQSIKDMSLESSVTSKENKLDPLGRPYILDLPQLSTDLFEIDMQSII